MAWAVQIASKSSAAVNALPILAPVPPLFAGITLEQRSLIHLLSSNARRVKCCGSYPCILQNKISKGLCAYREEPSSIRFNKKLTSAIMILL
jgi:hypothetical protein